MSSPAYHAVKHTLRRKDFQSDTWERLCAAWTARVADLSSQLATIGLDERIADSIRGRIAELQSLLTLQKEAATQASRDVVTDFDALTSQIAQSRAPLED